MRSNGARINQRGECRGVNLTDLKIPITRDRKRNNCTPESNNLRHFYVCCFVCVTSSLFPVHRLYRACPNSGGCSQATHGEEPGSVPGLFVRDCNRVQLLQKTKRYAPLSWMNEWINKFFIMSLQFLVWGARVWLPDLTLQHRAPTTIPVV
jgi:hypothetical protein